MCTISKFYTKIYLFLFSLFLEENGTAVQYVEISTQTVSNLSNLLTDYSNSLTNCHSQYGDHNLTNTNIVNNNSNISCAVDNNNKLHNNQTTGPAVPISSATNNCINQPMGVGGGGGIILNSSATTTTSASSSIIQTSTITTTTADKLSGVIDMRL